MEVLAENLEDKYYIKNEFISYGLGKFDKSKFNPIINRKFVKPHGGLWSSPVYSNWGWKDWCESEDFMIDKLQSSYFKFKLKNNSKIYVVDDLDDLESLFSIVGRVYSSFIDVLNFERMSMIYDGMMLTEYGQCDTRLSDPNLYGWDCESLLVFNPDVIEVVGE